MLDAFKQLVESGVMTEETKTVIESAFTTKLQETREKVTAELREEFAQKYNDLIKVRGILEKSLQNDFDNAVLLCSENEPLKCHRSLLSKLIIDKFPHLQIIDLV